MSNSKANSKASKAPSRLISAAQTLDGHFHDLVSLAERIEHIDLKNGFDFDLAERLMKSFSETGEAIGTVTAEFATALNETRAQAEAAAQKVAEKAEQLKIKKEERNEKMGRLQELNLKVNTLNQSLIQFKRPVGDVLSDEDKELLKGRLRDTANQITGLITEAEQLKQVGKESNLKTLERNAEAMRKSLLLVNDRLNGLIVTH